MTRGEAVIGEERQVEVTGYSGRTTATVRVVSYDRAQRVRRALKGLVTWWGVALVSVLIPIAHFVLVPSFFLYGVYTFARRLTADQVAMAGRGACPDCRAERALDVTGRWPVPQGGGSRTAWFPRWHRSARSAVAWSTSPGSTCHWREPGDWVKRSAVWHAFKRRQGCRRPS